MTQVQLPFYAVYKSPIARCKECLLGKDYSKNPTVNNFPKYQGQDPCLDRLLVPPNKAVLECYARENTTCAAYKFYKVKITNMPTGKKKYTKPKPKQNKPTHKTPPKPSNTEPNTESCTGPFLFSVMDS